MILLSRKGEHFADALHRRGAVAAAILLVLALTADTKPAESESDESDENFNLNPTNGTHSCRTREGLDGVCVKYSQCRSNDTVDIYGNIYEEEERNGNCPGRHDWCCLNEAPYQPSSLKTECAAIVGDDCPWCTTLHRDGGAEWTLGKGGRFCAGALVGDGGVLLTTTSCLRAAAKQNLWLQHQGINYTVHTARTNPLYNSGSREHDLAVVVLNKPIPGVPTTCLQFEESGGDECRAVGFTPDGEMILTSVTVTEGRCGERGGEEGALCGRAAEPATCRVSLGGPLLCPDKSGGWGIRGISRGGGCNEGAMFSSLAHPPDRDFLMQLLPNPAAIPRSEPILTRRP